MIVSLEKYFALKLKDYEMSNNDGNWQWASGSGVDAAPYFRIFNPHTQIQIFAHRLCTTVQTKMHLGADLREAAVRAYATVDEIQWDGMQLRRDIGWRSLS